MDAQMVEKLERRIRELEGRYSVWRGWRSGFVVMLTAVVMLIGGLWKATIDPMNARLSRSERAISGIHGSLRSHGQTLSTVLTLTSKDREFLDRLDKRLDIAFKRLNQIQPYPGN